MLARNSWHPRLTGPEGDPSLKCESFMLAYGKSKRTLRFSCGGKPNTTTTSRGHPSDLTSSLDELWDAPSERFTAQSPISGQAPTAGNTRLLTPTPTRSLADDAFCLDAWQDVHCPQQQQPGRAFTPDPAERKSQNLANVMMRRWGPPEGRESLSPSCRGTRDFSARSSGRGQATNDKDGAGARPQFRLEMDFGSDRDSSDNEREHRNSDVCGVLPGEQGVPPSIGETPSWDKYANSHRRPPVRGSFIHEPDPQKEQSGANAVFAGAGRTPHDRLQRPAMALVPSRTVDSSPSYRPLLTSGEPYDRNDHSEGNGTRDDVDLGSHGSRRAEENSNLVWSEAPFVTPDHERHEGVTEPPRPWPQRYSTHQPFESCNAHDSRPAASTAAGNQDTLHESEATAFRRPPPSSAPRMSDRRWTIHGRGTDGPGGNCDDLADRPSRSPGGQQMEEDEGRMMDRTRLKRSPSLISVRDVYSPELSRIWPFQKFNSVQSAVFPTVAKSDRNIVISAPTGCGKTVVLEMAIARLLHETGMHLGNRKIIYIAPIKALCQQTLDDWTAKFSPLKLRLAELTSDSASGPSQGSLREIAKADIILTTPEKWDSVTRRWKEHQFLVGLVALVLVDEVHTIGEERGATLEVILTRMKLVSRSPEVVSKGLPGSRMRFIALSATLPNATDIGAFVGAEVFQFGEEYRPVPLQTHVMGYSSGNNPFLFDRGLNKHVAGIVARYSNGKPALIFCGSKKDTEALAAAVAQARNYARGTGSQQIMEYLGRAADEADDPQLGKLMRKGVAIHNSGLSPGDRGMVERAFLSGSLSVLVATTTLAMGVNLPARLVIIKGTNHYRGTKGYQELPRSSILQMIGRAGRPGFDSNGVAVIMTSQANKKAFEQLSAGQEAVESSLQARLLEALNSEVCQGETIHDIGEAIEWLRSTFYFIRCQKNPSFYKLPNKLTEGDLHTHVQTMCLKHLKQLRAAGVIAMDDDQFAVSPTAHGVLFSRFMVRFESIEAIMSVDENDGTRRILEMCAGCDELNTPLRRAEKRLLNELNKQVRYPPPKKDIVRTPADKMAFDLVGVQALVLLQAALGNLPVEDWTLRGEQATMLDLSARFLGCCAESLAVNGRGGGLACAISLRLARSVRLRMWTDTKLGQLRQLFGVGDTMCSRLGNSEIITLVDLARTSAAKVDTLAGRKHPFGHGIRHSALHLLSRSLTASVCRHRLETGQDELQVRLQAVFQSTEPFGECYLETPDPAYAPPSMGWHRRVTDFQLLVYFDRSTSADSVSKDEEAGLVPSSSAKTDARGAGDPQPSTSSGNKEKQGALLLFRKVSGEGIHSICIPPDAISNDWTIHLWLICAGVCGMDVTDLRMRPSMLDDHFLEANEIRRIWLDDGRAPDSETDNTDERTLGQGARSAGDRDGWSEWEQASKPVARVRSKALLPPTNSSNAGTKPLRGEPCDGPSVGAKRKVTSLSEKAGVPGISRDLPTRKARGKGQERATSSSGVPSGVRARVRSEEGLRQMDIASSFKAAARRSRSASSRKQTNASSAHPAQGLSRGDLGAIGVSEAGDELGMRSDVSTFCQDTKGRPATTTPSRQRQQQPRLDKSRTWGSMTRASGSVFKGEPYPLHPTTYNPEAKGMRALLQQKGAEMNLSSLVRVDRLGRSRGSITPNGAWLASVPRKDGTGVGNNPAAKLMHGDVGDGGGSGHGSHGSHKHGSRGGYTTISSPVLSRADSTAVIDLSTRLSDPAEAQPQYPLKPSKTQFQQQTVQESVDFSAFSYDRARQSCSAPAATSGGSVKSLTGLSPQQLRFQGEGQHPDWSVALAGYRGAPISRWQEPDSGGRESLDSRGKEEHTLGRNIGADTTSRVDENIRAAASSSAQQAPSQCSLEIQQQSLQDRDLSGAWPSTPVNIMAGPRPPTTENGRGVNTRDNPGKATLPAGRRMLYTESRVSSSARAMPTPSIRMVARANQGVHKGLAENTNDRGQQRNTTTYRRTSASDTRPFNEAVAHDPTAAIMPRDGKSSDGEDGGGGHGDGGRGSRMSQDGVAGDGPGATVYQPYRQQQHTSPLREQRQPLLLHPAAPYRSQRAPYSALDSGLYPRSHGTNEAHATASAQRMGGESGGSQSSGTHAIHSKVSVDESPFGNRREGRTRHLQQASGASSTKRTWTHKTHGADAAPTGGSAVEQKDAFLAPDRHPGSGMAQWRSAQGGAKPSRAAQLGSDGVSTSLASLAPRDTRGACSFEEGMEVSRRDSGQSHDASTISRATGPEVRTWSNTSCAAMPADNEGLCRRERTNQRGTHHPATVPATMPRVASSRSETGVESGGIAFRSGRDISANAGEGDATVPCGVKRGSVGEGGDGAEGADLEIAGIGATTGAIPEKLDFDAVFT